MLLCVISKEVIPWLRREATLSGTWKTDMKLTMLKPRLKASTAQRMQTLDMKAGATRRITGYTWQKIRRAVMARDRYQCQLCGCVSMAHEVDHVVPLEQGGANEMDNLRLTCVECHKAKTAREAAARAGGG